MPGERKPCGFCQTKDCHLCPEKIAGGSAGKDWECPCAVSNHGRKTARRKRSAEQ